MYWLTILYYFTVFNNILGRICMYDTIPKTQEHTGMCSLNSFILINFVCRCESEHMSGAPRTTSRLSLSTIRVPGTTQVINLGIEHLYPFSYLAAQVAFLHRNKESYFIGRNTQLPEHVRKPPHHHSKIFWCLRAKAFLWKRPGQ